LGDPVIKNDEEDEGIEPDELGTRLVEHGECVSVNGCLQLNASQSYQPFYTADEVRAFRSFGLETGMILAYIIFQTSDISQGIQLLGFKDHSELLFEDNIKHSTFIYPNEDVSPIKKRYIHQLMTSRHTLVASAHSVHFSSPW